MLEFYKHFDKDWNLKIVQILEFQGSINYLLKIVKS